MLRLNMAWPLSMGAAVLAPQIAGRDDTTARPGLVSGNRFAPEDPLWATMVGVKRAGSHLFLRYSFGNHETRGTGTKSPPTAVAPDHRCVAW